MTQKTHAAELALLGINTVSFDRNKDTHGTEVHAPVFCMAVMGPVAQVGVDIHLCSYTCCGPDFHSCTPLYSMDRENQIRPGF